MIPSAKHRETCGGSFPCPDDKNRRIDAWDCKPFFSAGNAAWLTGPRPAAVNDCAAGGKIRKEVSKWQQRLECKHMYGAALSVVFDLGLPRPFRWAERVPRDICVIESGDVPFVNGSARLHFPSVFGERPKVPPGGGGCEYRQTNSRSNKSPTFGSLFGFARRILREQP